MKRRELIAFLLATASVGREAGEVLKTVLAESSNMGGMAYGGGYLTDRSFVRTYAAMRRLALLRAQSLENT